MFKTNKHTIKNSPLAKWLNNWFLTVTLPGFDGVPVHKVAEFFVKELQKDKIGPRASAISFSFMLALFPFIIFIFSLIPVIPINGLQDGIFDLLESVLPEQAFTFAHDTILDTVTNKRVDLTSVVFLLMIFFATNGINAVLKSFAKTNPAFKARSFAREYGVAFILTIVLTIFFILALSLIIFGNTLIRLLIDTLQLESSTTTSILFVVKWVLIVSIYLLAISIIYYFAPALKKKWRFISLGGTVATLLSVMASIGFSSYVNNVNQYNRFYGSIGAMLVIMIWIYINSLVLLIGFELNNSIRLFQLYDEEQQELEENDAHLGV